MGAGLEDDFRQLVVGVDGGRQRLGVQPLLLHLLNGNPVGLEGNVIAVKEIVENHAQGIEIDCLVELRNQLKQLRRGKIAEVVVGNGGKLQILQRRQTQVADHIPVKVIDENVLRLEVLEHVARVAQGAQGVAQVDAQVQSLQLGDGVLLQEGVQGHTLGHKQIDVIARAVLLRLDLIAGPGRDAAVAGQGLQPGDLPLDFLGDAAVVRAGGGLVGHGTGEQQRLGFHLRLGDGDVLEHEPVQRLLLLHQITGAPAVGAQAGHGVHSVQQGRDKLQFGHGFASFFL